MDLAALSLTRLTAAADPAAIDEALAHGPNINAPMDPATVARAVGLARYADWLARKGTPLEQALTGAMLTRYSSAPDADRAALDAAYADAIGVEASLVVGADGRPTGLVAAAKAAGLPVHVWTLRKENAFLPPALRKGATEAATGDFAAAWTLLAAAGVEGVFTDDPALAVPLRRSALP